MYSHSHFPFVSCALEASSVHSYYYCSNTIKSMDQLITTLFTFLSCSRRREYYSTWYTESGCRSHDNRPTQSSFHSKLATIALASKVQYIRETCFRAAACRLVIIINTIKLRLLAN
ncbi:uncharacterized protein BO72DRAFT_249547 [Aspergillus fijiensis CBS 313.89]|uniref:Uncharacterized protein n=1 Tax=Aspergillus fijiensis CBS 313.89 TaxID=1448319 RepID=A0A8G1VUG9_9EURO|nr:uncharacterized protein BO72DRAFT_249547 [Aspergillus fijiensis CBS 313.89]RAK73082.1 hypothetical protein BO72DRAFT_249547 [Aspergillus fijiensis CBS 313.89]